MAIPNLHRNILNDDWIGISVAPMLGPHSSTGKVSVATKITHLSVRDIRFPTSRSLDGSDAMNAAPDYSAAYVVLAHRRQAGARRPRADLHHRPRQRDLRRGDEVAGAPRRRADAGRNHRRHGRVLAPDHHRRQPAALARPGEGRDPPGHRRHRQRGVGPVGQGRGQAGVEAAGRHDARSSWCAASTSATSPTRSRPTRRSPSCAATRRARPRARRKCASRATRPTPPRPAGSATPTTRCAAWRAKAWPRAGPTSS